jgi:hypothetical protein
MSWPPSPGSPARRWPACGRLEFVVPDTVTTYSPARIDVPAVVDVSAVARADQGAGQGFAGAAAAPYADRNSAGRSA